MRLSRRTTSIDASGIRKMFELAQTLKNPIDLSLGVSDRPIPESIWQTVKESVSEAPATYSVTAGDLGVRKHVAEKLKKKNSIDARPEDIILTHGLTGGLSIALFSLVDPDDEVIIIDPYFVLYPQLIRLMGGKVVSVQSKPTWRLPLEGIQKAITARTKAIILNTPNNPTGVVYTREELGKLVQILRGSGIVIVGDEVYEEYVYDVREHVSVGSLYSDTITLMCPSKTASLAGWRAGYAHAPEEYISEMTKVQQILYVCSSTLGQTALDASLQHDYTGLKEHFQEKRDLVVKHLGSHAPLYGLEGAFYAFVPVRSIETCMKKLIDHEVLVTPGNVFSEEKDYIRIAYGGNKESLERGLEIIAREV